MDRKDLDRPEYGSYEEVHEKLVAAMQEACMNDRSREYDTPVLDMSFLYEEPEKEAKKGFRFNRLSTVVAIIIVMLLGLNAVMLFSDSNEVYSEKGLLHRIHEGVRGIFTDEDPSKYVEVDETGEVFIITDMKDIDKAKAFWPELCVPEYVPEGYEFEKLEINKITSGNYKAMYLYYYSSDKIKILIENIDNDSNYISKSKGKTIVKDDRVINTYYDKIYNKIIADVYLDDVYICIQGNITQQDIIHVASNIKKLIQDE